MLIMNSWIILSLRWTLYNLCISYPIFNGRIIIPAIRSIPRLMKRVKYDELCVLVDSVDIVILSHQSIQLRLSSILDLHNNRAQTK